jgi:hypothetical protein
MYPPLESTVVRVQYCSLIQRGYSFVHERTRKNCLVSIGMIDIAWPAQLDRGRRRLCTWLINPSFITDGIQKFTDVSKQETLPFGVQCTTSIYQFPAILCYIFVTDFGK